MLKIKLITLLSISFCILSIVFAINSIASDVGGGGCPCGSYGSEGGTCVQNCPAGTGPTTCANDGPTNRCGGEIVSYGGDTCPIGFVKTCPTSNYVCDINQQISCDVTGTWTQTITNPTPTGIGVIPYVTDPYGGVSMTGCNCGWNYNEVIGGSEWSCLGGYTKCYSCSCIQVCAAVSPTAPNLVSPANGSSLTNTNVTLDWSDAAFGTSCIGGSNIYRVWVWDSVNQTWQAKADIPAGTTQYSFTGNMGVT